MTAIFNVLSREQNIHHSYLLEASAGTGKTFSIENIVVRMLIENNPELHAPLTIDQILVVTFTRAAARDLGLRIRSNIEKNLQALSLLQQGIQPESMPDYIAVLAEKDLSHVQKAFRNLQKALFCFDQAHIYTIHGFCARALRENVFESDVAVGAIQEAEPIADAQMISVIHDYFRTGIHASEFSTGQLKIVLKDHENSVEKLENEILRVLKRGLTIQELPGFSAQLNIFQDLMKNLKFDPELLLADCVMQAPFFKKLCDKSKKLKPENLQIFTRFAALFSKQSWDAIDFETLLDDSVLCAEAFAHENAAKNKKNTNTVYYPQLVEMLQPLQKLVEEARNPLCILTRLAYGCQKMLQRYFSEEEKLGFDDLLKCMQKAVQSTVFTNNIRNKYKAVIVDEFQDTDPIQWDIFHSLFFSGSEKSPFLYIVGDPKQSIYAFRQADIYTYLKAAAAIGEENHYSLNTNFRSQPSLVNALNSLFCEASCPGLIALPKLKKDLAYQPVLHAPKAVERNFEDNKGAVHFCLARAEGTQGKSSPDKLEPYFFAFISKEILKLEKAGIPFQQCAILVNDRYQGQRMLDHLHACNIPGVVQRRTSLTESSALPALIELIQAVLHPRHESSLKIALGGRIIGWTHEQVKDLFQSPFAEKSLANMYQLRKILRGSGISAFIYFLMQSSWDASNKTVQERLLSQINGLEFFQDLQQLAHILAEEEYHNHASPEVLLHFLHHFASLDDTEDSRIKRFQDPCQDAVQILTVYSSKGLEYEAVFTLGLISRPKQDDLLLPVKAEKSSSPILQPSINKNAEAYLAYREEMDAEKMRQLYVAMTRAKFRTYVPVAIVPGLKSHACASAMELFLGRLGYPKASLNEVYERISSYDGSMLRDFVKSSKASITYEELTDESSTVRPQVESISLTTHTAPAIPGHYSFTTSFTALSKVISHASTEVAPTDFFAKEKTPFTLPAGNETGNLLHKILEKVPFQLDKDELEKFILPYVQATDFHEWHTVVVDVIHTVLNTPLIDGLCLCAIPAEDCYRETEFLHPYENQGFLKGVIDLCFQFNGKYYLLDWKSNWLGHSLADYSNDRLQAAMEAHDYTLQAKLYRDALQRYLRVVDPRPFEEIFGGTFYVFLRGVSTNSGVWLMLCDSCIST